MSTASAGKIVAVTNATAKNQGQNVVRELSHAGYHVRCLTRNTKSPDAIKLQEYKNVTLVQADINDIASIEKAFEGADIIVANSIPDPQSIIASPGTPVKEDTKTLSEYEQGKRYADVAKKVGAKIVIWATLPDVAKISNGKYDKVTHFQEKVRVQEYMKKIDLPACFVSPSYFLENFINFHNISQENGKIVAEMPRANVQDVLWCQIWMEPDFGRLIRLMIENYHTRGLKHRVICASEAPVSMQSILTTLTKLTGKEAVLKSTPYMIADGCDYDEMIKFYADPNYPMYEPDDVKFSINFYDAVEFKTHSFEDFAREKLIPSLGL